MSGAQVLASRYYVAPRTKGSSGRVGVPEGAAPARIFGTVRSRYPAPRPQWGHIERRMIVFSTGGKEKERSLRASSELQVASVQSYFQIDLGGIKQ